MASVRITYLGGPTALLELGGMRLLTDPTFDPPGDYPIGERILTKTHGPALSPERLGPVDAVLLSHDQHPDNLDRLGRELLSTVFSTEAAAERLGEPVRGLANCQRTQSPQVCRSRPCSGDPRGVVLPMRLTAYAPSSRAPLRRQVNGQCRPKRTT